MCVCVCVCKYVLGLVFVCMREYLSGVCVFIRACLHVSLCA